MLIHFIMGEIKKIENRDDAILTASEIGQFCYCSMSWYLKRLGYKPTSESIIIGRDKHMELGDLMEYTEKNIKKSKTLGIAGYILLTIAVLILLFEVIL